MGYAIKDGHFGVDSRLVGHQAWRETQQIQFRDSMIQITYIKGATFLALLTLYLNKSDRNHQI